MKFEKFDIGAEIISILTKGMYPDPRDAIREYIQNAVDAKSKNTEVKVRPNSVVVEDDGVGMDYLTLRNALRLGVSDKIPGKDVGFMGIGIYSAFHLCDTLTIYTRKAKKLPLKVEMDFRGMKELLSDEKEKRLSSKIDSEHLTDLQTLLQTHIELSDENSLSDTEFPVTHGTRVELTGLDPILDDSLNKFDELSKYLRDVVPLHFDKDNFEWGVEIEKRITKTCRDNQAHFDVVNLTLQVQSRTEKLYRPYKDANFANGLSQPPLFREIKKDKALLGVAWGCLNSARSRIDDKDLRGFLLKKQGFSIGRRENLAHFFGRSNTFFDRYIGEIIVVSSKLLPNAARSELESSEAQKWFAARIAEDVAPFYNTLANKFQEESKAADDIEKSGDTFKKLLGGFNEYEDNYENLIDLVTSLAEIARVVKSKRSKLLDQNQKAKADKLLEQIDALDRKVKDGLEDIIRSRKRKGSKKLPVSKVDIAKNLDAYDASRAITKFESLLNLYESLQLESAEEIKELLLLIDEKFIEAQASSKADYYRLLDELKTEFENRNNS